MFIFRLFIEYLLYVGGCAWDTVVNGFWGVYSSVVLNNRSYKVIRMLSSIGSWERVLKEIISIGN